MLVEVETIRDQTTGDLAGAAMQMRTLQEAMTNQQTKMSKVEEVITTTAASAAADQNKNARHGGKNDANDERERRTQEARHICGTGRRICGTGRRPFMTNWPPARLPRWEAKTMQELVQAAEDRLVYRQVGSVHAKKQHSDAREVEVSRQWSAVTLWCLLCTACWETCQGRDDSMVYQTNYSVQSEHFCKSVNPHRHCATDTSTRKHSNRTKRAEHGNPRLPQSKQITIVAINTTSLGRHWHNMAREKDITHWACTEVRMLKEDQLWFSERYTKEDKISVTWGPPMNRREDGQPEFGGTCVISRQPAFSVPFENSGYHEWLLTTKRFLMVKIPTGNGSKNVTVMVVYAYPGEARKRTPKKKTQWLVWQLV